MRLWLFPPLIVLLFSACSRESAFEHFTRLDSLHERAVTQLRRATLGEANRTQALISVIYLNPVEPESYGEAPAFLVALFDRNGSGLETYKTTLNGREPAGIVRLDENCSLRSLMPLDNPWNSYYQLLFAAEADDNLTLRFENGPSLQGEVTYYTDR